MRRRLLPTAMTPLESDRTSGDAVPVCRHSWIWFALGPSHRRIDVHGDPSLARYLRESGLDVLLSASGDEPPPAVDAVVTVVGTRPDRGKLLRRSRPSRPGQTVAIAVGGGRIGMPVPTHRIVRALELIGSFRDATASLLLARYLLKELRKLGLSVRVVPTGDRSRKHGIGRGGWPARRRPPVGWIVVATSGPVTPSAVDVALAETAAAVGGPLSPSRTDVFESGTILLRGRSPAGRSFYLRLAGGRGAPRLEASLRNIAAVIAADSPARLRERLVEPLVHGEIGSVRYVVEDHARGEHPRSLEGERRRSASEFLDDLHGLDASATPSTAAVSDAVAGQVERVSAYVRPAQLMTLDGIRTRLEPSLGRIPIGFRHGDFWPENLLYRGEELTAVLDWEWASHQSFPIFDVFDLLSTAEWRDRRRPFGARITNVLLPLWERGDPRLGEHEDRETLLTLIAAYWLDRISRDLTISPKRELSEPWSEANIHRPLAAIERAFARPAAVVEERGSQDIVVLCYHGTSATWRSELSVRPESLVRQIEILHRRGYHGATFSDAILERRFAKVFAVTFDDAYLSVFENAFPVLARMNVPATVFVPTDFPDTKDPMSWEGIETWLETPDAAELMCMSWEQLRELARHGWEIGSHTCSHPHLTRLSDAALADELLRSRLACERQLGTPCLSIAYPYGDVDARVVAAARETGYRLGATLPVGFHAAARLHWPRVGVYGTHGELKFRLKSARTTRRLRARYARLARRPNAALDVVELGLEADDGAIEPLDRRP